MTDLAKADLHGAVVGTTSSPSPPNASTDAELPPPPPPAPAPAMPAPLVHQPTVTVAPKLPLSPPVTDELPALTPQAAPPLQPAADPVIAKSPTFAPQSEPVAEPESLPTPQAAPPFVTGPAAILAPIDAVTPLDDATAILPSVAAAAPQVAAQAAAQAAIDSLLMPNQQSTASKKKKKKAGSGRFGKFVLTTAVVGGLGFAGVTYGPGLYDQYIADEEPTEPAAPMAFPRSRTTTPDVRTATFVLDGLASGSEASYTITVDFDTAVSRVAIDRTDGPDLEVLTFANDALVRRLDSSSWFQMERGAFPLDDQLQQTDWIRMIDDVIPPERRSGVLIEASTVAMVAGVETRHLVLTLDPSLLELADESGASLDPIGDITDAAVAPPGTAPTDTPVAVPPATPGTPNGNIAEQPTTATADSTVAAGQPSTRAIDTVPVAGEPVSADAIHVELWIDRQGVVRRSVGADVLGANSITILETAAEGWVPDYPDASNVKPVTAAALLDLGL